MGVVRTAYLHYNNPEFRLLYSVLDIFIKSSEHGEEKAVWFAWEAEAAPLS